VTKKGGGYNCVFVMTGLSRREKNEARQRARVTENQKHKTERWRVFRDWINLKRFPNIVRLSRRGRSDYPAAMSTIT